MIARELHDVVGHNISLIKLQAGVGLDLTTSTGSGIAGMRERAIALGGPLDARRRPTGGFEVSAHLPAGASL